MKRRRRSFWLRARHALEYAAMASLGALLKVMPRRAALALGAAIGQVGWWARIRRRLVLENLAVALPEATAAERRRIAARAARNFGRTVIEFLRFSGRDRERVLELVDVAGLEELRAALEDGQGAILVTGHLGAWALYVTALGAAGIDAALLVGVQTNPEVDELILGIPGDAVQFISKSKRAPRDILQAKKAGKVIVMVADHYSSEQRVWAPFLGKNAFTLPLPGAMVARYGMPLFVMAGHRVEGGHHELEVRRLELPELGGEDPRHESEDAVRAAVAVRSNAALGEAIRRHPEQYFWYHNRFKVRVKRGSPPRIVVGDPPWRE